MHFTLPCDKIRDMVEIIYNRNCVYQTAYHVIWCPKYRKRILTGGIAETLRLAINAICIEREWPILTLEIQPVGRIRESSLNRPPCAREAQFGTRSSVRTLPSW